VPVPAPRPAPPIESQNPPQEALPAPLVLSANGVDPVNLAVEVTRIVPGSGNLTIHRQQFWLGPDRAGTPVTFWADTTVVHLLHHGVRLKTVPSRPDRRAAARAAGRRRAPRRTATHRHRHR
jgi:hypothetical protein